jgi:hypothetical protein
MTQVKSIDYEDAPAAATANATAPAPTPAAAADQNSQTPAPAPMSANVPPAANGEPESHEHPAESAITTKTYVLGVGTKCTDHHYFGFAGRPLHQGFRLEPGFEVCSD